MTGPTSPLVSLVLTTCDNQADVRAAVRSAMAQDYAPLEILISDDASRDGTCAILDEEVARYCGPHLVVLERCRERLGPLHVDQWKRSVRGAFIVRAGGDAVARPDRVRRLVAAWQAERVSLVVGESVGAGEDAARPPPRPSGRVAIEEILGDAPDLEIEESVLAYEPELLTPPSVPPAGVPAAGGAGLVLLFRASLRKGVYRLGEALLCRPSPAGGNREAGQRANPLLALEGARADAAAGAVRCLAELSVLAPRESEDARHAELQRLVERRILQAARDWIDVRRQLSNLDLRPTWVAPLAAGKS